MPGYLAVDLFFVLSGFVIAANYTDRLANQLSVAKFFEVRLIRLFPLYVLGFALGIAKMLAGHALHIPSGAQEGNISCALLFGTLMLPNPCLLADPQGAGLYLFPLNRRLGPYFSSLA